jgi:hypothetical protein
MHGAGTTGSAGETRPSLRNGLTAYSALSPVTGLCCHRRSSDSLSPATLAPALGRQDHTAWPSARPRSSAFRKECCDVSRPPLPASTFVTIAIRPSSMRRDVRNDAADLPDTPSGIFFAAGLDGWNRVERACEISFCVQWILRVTAAQMLDERLGLNRLPDLQITLAVERERNP